MRSVLKTVGFGALALTMLASGSGTASAAYDIDTLGIPKFVNVNYIELAKITRISKYRSKVGHNYSDAGQFGTGGYRDSRNRIEQCASMKHYFVAPDTGVKMYSPISGTVTSIRVGSLGSSIEIRADAYPDFNFGIFHIALDQPLLPGEHVSEGQFLGRHASTETWSDMSVWVQTARGKHLISYFDTLTDDVFAQFQARGVATREALSNAKEIRDADLPVCSFSNPDSDFVNLSGPGPRLQTVSVQTTLDATLRIGDAPVELKATASSGLPAIVVSATPKVCAVENNIVTARRPGACRLLVTQPGDDTYYEATAATVRTTVITPDASAAARPRLSGVLPPGGGPQSYLRFYNAGTVAGTVTASLIDGSTGQAVAKWQSPPIPAGASPQFAVDTLEAAATAPFTRPSLYSLRVEPETTVDGFLQHVLFDGAAQALTNASTCDVGVTTSRYRMMNVHSSHFDFAYPSTIVLNNIGLTSASMGLVLRDAANGNTIGRFYSGRLSPTLLKTPTSALPGSQVVVPEALMETVVALSETSATTVNIAPPSAFQFNLNDEVETRYSPDNSIVKYYYQHVVTNKKSGAISDMSTVCALSGKSAGTANKLLQVGGISSTISTAGPSSFRFYNSGTTAGPVTLTLYGNIEDQPLGTWISPAIAAGAMLEVPIATIEKELKLHVIDFYVPMALTKQNLWGIAVRTDIDGFFQHVHTRGPDGAVTNLSTCSDAVTTAGKTLMGVNSSVMDTAGYASAVVIANTGTAAAAARINVYDARDGALLGSAPTEAIAAGGLLRLDIATIEAGAHITPTGDAKYYIVKVEEPFTGALQHLVNNKLSGVISDMTAVCMM